MRGGTYVSLLSLTDAGQNELRILHLSVNAIIVYVHNVAEDGKETDLVGIIGMYGILNFPLLLSHHMSMSEISFRKSRGVGNIHYSLCKVFVFVFTDLSILEGNLIRIGAKSNFQTFENNLYSLIFKIIIFIEYFKKIHQLSSSHGYNEAGLNDITLYQFSHAL